MHAFLCGGATTASLKRGDWRTKLRTYLTQHYIKRQQPLKHWTTNYNTQNKDKPLTKSAIVATL